MTKNSETIDPCKICGGRATCHGQDNPMIPSIKLCRVHCDSCGLSTANYRTRQEAIHHWNTRAPERGEGQECDHLYVNDGEATICQKCGTTPERGEGQGDGKPFPELYQVINHIAPMLSGEKEAGIERQNIVDAYEQAQKYCAKNPDVDFIDRFCEDVFQLIALSRQSAVGGDWEKELDRVKDAYALVAQHIKWSGEAQQHDTLFFAALNDLRRVLRCATRTPEGEGDESHAAIPMLIRDNERMRKAGGKLAEAALRVIREYDGLHRLSLAVSEWSKAIADEGDRPHGPAPPPRPTATGGITERQIKSVLSGLGTAEYLGRDGEFHQLEGAVWVGDACRDLLALIERAGEEDHE